MQQQQQHRKQHTHAVLLVVLLAATCCCAADTASAAASPAAPPSSAAAADEWEASLVTEAVDLSAAHTNEQLEDTKGMESLLHWAIEHSDPGALAQQAEAARREELIKDWKERKQRVQELSDIVSQQPTETQLMQDHIALLKDDAASSQADKAAALAQLQVLVEPIDNANDLRVLGALPPLVSLLGSSQPPELQAGAAYVLGTAVSNNEKLAGDLMSEHPQLLQLLLQLASAHAHEEPANKAMYALARLVAGPAPAARAAFYNAGGLAQLQALMRPSAGASKRVQTKAVNLVTDLIELTATGDDSSMDTWSAASLDAFAAAALDLLQSAALDLLQSEKALHAMRSLLLRRSPAGGAALAAQGAEAVLREELTELDLLASRLADDAAAAAAAAADASEGVSGSSSAASGAAAEQDDEPSAAEVAAHEHQFATYVGHLCADVLHHLAIQHEEL